MEPAGGGHRQGYVEAVLQAGGLPVLLPPLTDPRALRALYERLDGVLLAGGDDIDPFRYGETPHPKLGPVSPERDTAELQLARWAFADGKPLLGICRGMQVINVARGGSSGRICRAITRRASTTTPPRPGGVGRQLTIRSS